MEDELGKNFWLKTVAVVIGLGILGILSFFLFTGLHRQYHRPTDTVDLIIDASHKPLPNNHLLNRQTRRYFL